jgi:hypothetical protein
MSGTNWRRLDGVDKFAQAFALTTFSWLDDNIAP